VRATKAGKVSKHPTRLDGYAVDPSSPVASLQEENRAPTRQHVDRFRNFSFTICVNVIFTTLVTPRFTALFETVMRIKAPLACVVRASVINRAATLIAY
jgi:hypothetical protein